MDFVVRSHVHLPPAATAAGVPTAYQSLDTTLRRPSIHLPQAGFSRHHPQQQQQYQETARLPPTAPPSSSAESYTTATAINSNPRTRLSIAHVTDGLRTPPPEMTSYPATRLQPVSTRLSQDCTRIPTHEDRQYHPVAPLEPSTNGMNHRRQDTSSSYHHPTGPTVTATRSPMQQHSRPQTADSNRSSASYAQHSQPLPKPTQQQEEEAQHESRVKQEPQAKQEAQREESSRSRSVSRPSGATLAVPSTILENSDLSLADFAAQVLPYYRSHHQPAN